MSAYATLDEWLSTISKEYLQDYIRTGGAAVKFVIPVEGTGAAEIKTRLQRAAEGDGFLFALVDAASVKIHMVDQLFYQVARQVDWSGLAYSFLRGLLGQHYKIPERREAFDLKRIAALNGVDEKQMRSNVNERLKQALFRDYAMTQEFRIAMLKLCQAQLDPGEVSSALCDSIVWWLRGELRLISALKPALIFQKVGRHNARHLLLSLSHWIRIAGGSGLVLVLDISRYMSDRPREPDGTLYYSKAAVMDCYETLRQFVDGTDEAEFLLVVVLAPPQFTSPDEGRGVYIYDALKLRIWDEVYDRSRVNPLSSLVRVTKCPGASEALEGRSTSNV